MIIWTTKNKNSKKGTRNNKVGRKTAPKRIKPKSAPLALASAVTGTRFMVRGSSVIGSDLLEKISSAMSGFVINLSCNPSCWADTRICTFASIYAMYRPKRLKLTFKPSCPATTAGALVYGTSVGSNISSEGTEVLKQLLSTPGSKMMNVWSEHSWMVPLDMLPQKWFYTDSGHDVDSEPFRMLVCLADVVESPDVALGYLTIEYEYEFVQPTAGQTTRLDTVKAISTMELASPGELTFNLGTAAKFTRIVFSTITSALKNYVLPGIEYGLSPTTTSGVYTITNGGTPIVTTSSLASQAVTAVLGFLREWASPIPVVTCELGAGAKFGRQSDLAADDHFLVIPPVGGRPAGSVSLTRK